MTYQIPKLYPNAKTKNLCICVSGLGGSKEHSILITNCIPDLNCLDSGTQCFPLYYYEEQTIASPTLFDAAKKTALVRRDGVSDYILGVLQKAVGNNVGKEDIFYYVYGFLHSPTYRTRFASDLKKMLPRLPLPNSVQDFWQFSKAGRKLADLHIHYETAPRPANVTVIGEENNFFRVEKMRFPSKDDKTKIILNSKISIENIPATAYEYIVNGKSAIEWIMERYAVTTHKESNIKNDPNDWATEVGKPKYILELLLSVITVSLETMKIVNGLPEIKLE